MTEAEIKPEIMEIEFSIKMVVEGNKISVSNTLPFDAQVQDILNALEQTHHVILTMSKKAKKSIRPTLIVKDLYKLQQCTTG